MRSQPTRSPLPAGQGSTVGRKFSASDITGKGEQLPNRFGLHAREGWGKTSLGAYMPKTFFLQARGETGLDTLIEAKQIPETPHFPELQNWSEIRAAVQWLIDEPHDYRVLNIDTINSAERLLYDFVCERDFGGDWGDKGFGGYQRGYEVSMAEWKLFLNSLDELRRTRKMTPFLLIHTKVKTFRNPDGADYDRWLPDLQEKCWSLTHKWLDAVLFGQFEVDVQQTKRDQGDATKKGKVKASSLTSRVLYTQWSPSYDAKNRLGLPAEIDMGDTAKEGWANLAAALKAGRAVTAAEQGATDGE